MPRTRKRHLQQDLFRHGGKRKGAGRPPRGPRASERHKRRERFRSYEPVHVTLRVVADVRPLRRRAMYAALRWASLAVAHRQQDTFRIVHYSVQGDHLHLLCEAVDFAALAAGVKGFAGSAAKRINKVLSRRGCVFPDRYHVRVLKSPTTARNAISYVLNNWRHHRRDEHATAALVDPYSSGARFLGWKHLARESVWRPPRRDDGAWVWLPQTWLLREGWRRAGSISALEVRG